MAAGRAPVDSRLARPDGEFPATQLQNARSKRP
jgi:hypothetical protein